MRWLAVVAALALLVSGSAWLAVCRLDLPPRSLATWLDRTHGDRAASLSRVARWSAQALRGLDRGPGQAASPLYAVGAPAVPDDSRPSAGRSLRVGSVAAARRAIDAAMPGDVITFESGRYRIDGSGFEVRRPGTVAAPIVVRAERPGGAVLEFDVVEGFNVAVPYWTFENLFVRGVCAEDGRCEHAFHVVAGATHFVARNNTVVDFNAHFKINGQDGLDPDDGLLEGNTLTATRPRRTDNPVTDIDLVAASGWTIRGNRISDFVKAGGDRISYGAFAKGGGAANRFERNVVVCEDQLRGHGGARVGLSLGGGGTGAGSCRGGRCVTEQDGGVLDSNLIAACSDDGIYLNRAATSVVVHNTLLDTGGVVVRFPDAAAVVEGNLVDGTIRARDGGALHATDNLQADLAELYLGRHPLRDLFVDPAALNLRWRRAVPRRSAVTTSPSPLDLCGAARPAAPAYGAIEDFERCRTGGAANVRP